MPLPSVRDAIYQPLHTGAITQDAADLYLRNYELFPRKRTEIESTHPHMWVAAIDEQNIAERPRTRCCNGFLENAARRERT